MGKVFLDATSVLSILALHLHGRDRSEDPPPASGVRSVRGEERACDSIPAPSSWMRDQRAAAME